MGTLATSGAVVFKAGANVSTAFTEAQYDYAILQSEATINSMTRYNWIDEYPTLSADVKYILEETVTNLAAVYLINYDMSGYTSRGEAESMINVLRDAAIRGITTLTDIKKQTFMIGEA